MYDWRVSSARDRWALLAILATGIVLRVSFVVPGVWQQPWTPHHFDEHILPFEALGLWEGVTPREVGWPGSTVRAALSAVYGVRMLWDERRALAAARDPEAVLAPVARWSGERVPDAARLYQLGRVVVAAFGILQVVFIAQAASVWLGRRTMALAAAVAAVSPQAVVLSQVVLADIAGACFASLLLAVLPRLWTHRSSALWLGVLAGLAAASKLHFGVWLVLPVVGCWMPEWQVSRGERATATLTVLAGFGLTFLGLVPWLWLDPVLALKELAGVALVKVGSGAGVPGVVRHLGVLFGGLGWLSVVCAVPGLLVFVRSRYGPRIAVVGVVLGTAVVLSASAMVFERYGLVLLPGVVLLATAGLDRVLRHIPRLGTGTAAALVLVAGLPQTVLAVNQISRRNSYHLAHAWMMAHLPDGASVVIYSEDNQYLPRASSQLAACASYVWSDAAYQEKLATNDLGSSGSAGLPMRLAVLNDEFFHAFWCSRELLAVQSPAFHVYRFHADKRFQTLGVETVRAEFLAGLTDRSRGFDAVLAHWPLFPEIEPAVTFKADVPPTLRLYIRPGVPLRDVHQP